MNLSDHDLRQLDESYVRSLKSDQLVALSLKILADLKVARDRLNRTPQNSSVPSGSQPPWAGGTKKDTDSGVDEDDTDEEELLKDAMGKNAKEHEANPENDGDSGKAGDSPSTKSAQSPPATQKSRDGGTKKRKPGKQPGAPGYGRKVELPLTGPDEIHRAGHCAGCSAELGEDSPFTACTGLYVADVEFRPDGIPGMRLTHVKHVYGDVECACGHTTRTMPGRCEPEPGWSVELTEWHMVGPMLVSLIVCLSKRMRGSRPKVQEFLHDWLGLWLSTGTINQCIHEAGRAVEPLEDQMIEEIRQAELLNVDETPWKEKAVLLWFSVFGSLTVTLFVVGARSADALARILGDAFPGWLMSDGLKVYRQYLKRLRCWAHLDRKAKGLSESLDGEARLFGGQVLAIFKILRRAVYQAREEPPGTTNLRRVHGDLLGVLMLACQKHADSSHEKTRALARELLYDWEAIWAVLSNPFLPMTNNEAERLLRHWVIYRRICYGTRTAEGSRVVALLASVIETCRKRKVLPWPFLADTIARRRRGETVPPLPVMAAA